MRLVNSSDVVGVKNVWGRSERYLEVGFSLLSED